MLDVLWVAGPRGADDLVSWNALHEPLAAMGVVARPLCVSGVASLGPTTNEAYGLNHRWLRPWAVRALSSLSVMGPPDMILAVGEAQAGLALELAERWRRSYFLVIEEFPRPDMRLRLSRSWCCGVIVIDEEVGEELKVGFGLPGSRVHVMGPAIVVPEDEPAELPRGHVPVIGTALTSGSIDEQVTLLDAFRRALGAGREVEFVVGTTGDGESALRRLAEHFGIKDRLTLADLVIEGRAFWQALDVYVQSGLAPTTGRYVGRALGHGIPVVLTDLPGLRAWITPGKPGPIVPPGDADALAEAMLGLVNNPVRGRVLATAARDWIRKSRDPDRAAGQLVAILEEARDPEVPLGGAVSP